MYGHVGKITATPGRRNDLIGFLCAGADRMPGRRSYIVAGFASVAETKPIAALGHGDAAIDLVI